MEKYLNFIRIIKVLIPLYKKNKSSTYIKKILVTTIRMLEYVSPVHVSKLAQKKADKMVIGSLTKYIWKDQTNNNKMKDEKRKIFHWEHYYPVEQIIKELIQLKKLDSKSIYKVIRKTKIVWILKSENKELDKIARSIRPNPKLAYKKAGIEILK
jgi:hypothetical protein